MMMMMMMMMIIIIIIIIYFNTYNLHFYYFVLDQQMQNYFTNYHIPTCFDTIVSSSGSLQSVPCQSISKVRTGPARQ